MTRRRRRDVAIAAPPGAPSASRPRARRSRHGPAGRRGRRPGSAGDREDLGVAAGGPVSDPDRDAAVGAHAGRDDLGGVDPALRARPHSRGDGRADGPADRAPDLPGELLPPQGAAREGGRPPAAVGVRRPRARLARRARHPARRGPQDRDPGHDPRLPEPRPHLRGHTRAPDRQSPGLGATEAPEETEQALYAALDARWWPSVNLYLVTWGQNTCRPVYPRCGDCVIAADCPRLGVSRVGHSRKGAN